ncbi:MAG: pyruvate dehydrogenase (acetyl-transferring) E1 component subunit alpha [Phycisphaerae bacterium]|nr:pyruvate dehydrogenase (acetyl-transferring) E1 component subunit alpha [Phycisphaerae bacterium]
MTHAVEPAHRTLGPVADGHPRNEGAVRASARVEPDTLIGWLRSMMLIREFEVRCAQAYQQAKIGGFCHLYIGQEAAAVGTLNAVNPDDPVVLAYRDHGHALARGMDPGACMAEMYGKATGCAKGKGGSMHMFDRPHWLFGGHGIVGAQTPLGAGLAFAARYEWEVLGRSLENPGVPAGSPPRRKVCLCYLGDGALNQGALHEAMNLAGLYSLPVIYIVENNGYSMGTSIDRGTTMAHDLMAKANAYGIEGRAIDGFDILALYDEFKPLVDLCRQKQVPAFVDLKTYRYQGHSMSDPQKYRTKDEVEAWKAKDSIDRFAHHLMSERTGSDGRPVLSEQRFSEIQDDVRTRVRAAVEFAEASPVPDLSELYADVMVNPHPGMSPSGTYVTGAPNPLLR